MRGTRERRHKLSSTNIVAQCRRLLIYLEVAQEAPLLEATIVQPSRRTLKTKNSKEIQSWHGAGCTTLPGTVYLASETHDASGFFLGDTLPDLPRGTPHVRFENALNQQLHGRTKHIIYQYPYYNGWNNGMLPSLKAADNANCGPRTSSPFSLIPSGHWGSDASCGTRPNFNLSEGGIADAAFTGV